MIRRILRARLILTTSSTYKHSTTLKILSKRQKRLPFQRVVVECSIRTSSTLFNSTEASSSQNTTPIVSLALLGASALATPTPQPLRPPP